MPDSQPLISIVIRTYNRADRIGRAVRSALAQDWAHREIIVIDDGSKDNTREVLLAFPEIRYHYQENAGLQGARLAGLAQTAGEFVAYLDSDDEWHPDFLSRSMELFTRFPDSGLVFSNFEKVMFDRVSNENTFQLFPQLRPLLAQDPLGAHYLDPAALRALFIYHIPAPTSALVMRRALMPSTWSGVSKMSCDWMTALHMILHQRIAGAFWACPRWTKWCDRDAIADGAHDSLYQARVRTHDRQIMLDNFRPLLTPAEQAVMTGDVADLNFSAGYELANQRKIGLALKCLGTAFRYRPTASTALAIAKTCMKAVLPGKSRAVAAP